MKLKDFITAEQYFKSKQPKEPRKKAEKPKTLIELYLAKQAEADEIKKFMENIEKISKKEEKKPEPTKYTVPQMMMFMLGTAPITGAVYLWVMNTILNGIK